MQMPMGANATLPEDAVKKLAKEYFVFRLATRNGGWGSSNFPNGVFTAAIECDLQGYCGEEEEDLEEGAMLFVCADAGTGKVDDVDTWQAACAYVEISCHGTGAAALRRRIDLVAPFRFGGYG
jgi:hypothetical protein